MMSTLTDRYIAEVVRGVPESQRADVEQELRASIADAIDATEVAGSGVTAAAGSDDPGRSPRTQRSPPSPSWATRRSWPHR